MIELSAHDDFPSRAIHDGAGRVYSVHGSVELIAYVIEDATLPAARTHGGIIVYAFMDGRRVGYWNSTTEPEDLVWAMQQYRAAHVPGAPITVREPRIRPTYNREPAANLRMPHPELHFDVSHAFGEPEHDADVIPIDRRR